MIHLIELTVSEDNTKCTFVIENITTIIGSTRTRIYTNGGDYVCVNESVEEITNRIKEILYGKEEKL
jgi:uncharacterized protein YlzI (FlbEa/FlbD family)